MDKGNKFISFLRSIRIDKPIFYLIILVISVGLIVVMLVFVYLLKSLT